MTQITRRTLIASGGVGLAAGTLGAGLSHAAMAATDSETNSEALTQAVTTRVSNRPHIEFVQSQALPWQETPWQASHPNTDLKILSTDEDSGESSNLVRYPPGWTRSGRDFLTVDEEFLVLDGSIEINGVVYTEKCYAHLPAGYLRNASSSPDGAVVLTFFSGVPRRESGGSPPESYDASRLVQLIDLFNTEFSSDFSKLGVVTADPIMRGVTSAAFVLLREDRYTHEQTWVLCSRAISMTGVEEIHPVVEEMYLLEGEAVTDVGLMLPGAYFWRPPGLRHGPVGTKTGTAKFFRTKGGPLRTAFPDTGRQFSWEPRYQPILPPHLARYSRDTARSTLAY